MVDACARARAAAMYGLLIACKSGSEGEQVNSKKIQSDPHPGCVDKTMELTRKGYQ